MKTTGNKSIQTISCEEILCIKGGSISATADFPWGKVLLMVVSSWSSIKSGLHDGFYDGLK